MFHFLFTLLLVLSSQLASAEVREIKSMAEVVPHINSRTFLVFDLDNTVLEPVQMLGSDQNFGYWVEQGMKRGLTKEQATDRAIQMASIVQPHSRVRAVEGRTPRFIATLQRTGLPVIALTARPGSWARGTLAQVASLNVDFRLAAPMLRNSRLKNGDFINGVYFLTKGSDKGQALIEFMNEAGLKPERILFVDDKLHNVEAVERALEKTPLEHISFRYGAADPRVAAFNPVIAEIQWREYLKTGRFLSDEEATDLVERRRIP